MHLIDRLIFPRPKFKNDGAINCHLVHIPLFKDFSYYAKLKEHIVLVRKSMLKIKSSVQIDSVVSLKSPKEKQFEFHESVCSQDLTLSCSVNEKTPGQKDIGIQRRSFNPLQLRLTLSMFNGADLTKTDKLSSPLKIPLEMQMMTPQKLETRPRSAVFFNEQISKQTSLQPTPCARLTEDINSSYSELQQKVYDYLPCSYFEYSMLSDTLVYFHSNAEDLTQMQKFGMFLREMLKVNVILFEYPGYSVYGKHQTKPERIKFDALCLIHFLKDSLSIDLKNVMIVGRSMGSGPALFLASKFEFKLVAVASGFLSIKRVVQDRLSLLGLFVDHYFNNEDAVPKNQSPLLILHGRNDTLIKPYHAERLFELAESQAKILLFDDMPHNGFDLIDCLISPLVAFIHLINKRGKTEVSPDSLQSALATLFSKRIFTKSGSR